MNPVSSTPRQSIENLKGEIAFRAKLARQHVTGEVLLPDYFGRQEHDRILLERMQTTLHKMGELQRRGVGLSPFLELGAERGQRSLVLTNDFGASGVAVDISYHQLQTMDHFARTFKKEKLPVRICCDANHLPFRSNSFPFVFCYQFLHHFPSPSPVIAEIERVLCTGHFYFDEEPFKRTFKLRLYRQKRKLYAEDSLRKNRYLRLVESFISEAPCDEVEHGIIENDSISLREWMTALSVFGGADVDLMSIYNLVSKLGRHLNWRNIPNLLIGGTIAGLCTKVTGPEPPASVNIMDLLACPDCQIASTRATFDRPPLTEESHGYRCSRCGVLYPVKDGVIFLLPHQELEQLYPDF